MRYLLSCLYLIVAILFFLVGTFARSELNQLGKKGSVYIDWHEETLYIPTGRFLPYLSFGHKQVLADLLWLKAILYFGEHSLGDKNFPYLYHLLEIVTDLDPRFVEPYLFGGLVLSLEAGALEESNLILQKGMENLPMDWRIPFYLGFNHWYFLDARIEAADYIAKAARLPGAPSYLPRLASTLYLKEDQGEVAINILNELYRIIKDERMKKQILKKLESLEQH